MTDAEHLTDLRERFGPSATRVGDPPTAADVALLLRMLDQPKCVDDAKVAKIRERHKGHVAELMKLLGGAAPWQGNLTCADIDTLLASLDAERAKCDKVQALRGSETRRYLTETKEMQATFEAHYKPLVDAERSAVVAWLRMKSAKQKAESEDAMTPWYAAEQDALSCENGTNAAAIARGEHRDNRPQARTPTAKARNRPNDRPVS